MDMTQRGRLGPEDEQRLLEAKEQVARFESVLGTYRAVVVEMVDKSSYREVSRLAGISTNTLQRWVREAAND